MFGSAILEVAIGLGFIYLLLSIICSALQEAIAGMLDLRAKTLETGIQSMFNEPDRAGLAKRFYEHPLIKCLNTKGKPSYIPSRTFALALIDVLGSVYQVGKTAKEIIDSIDNIENNHIKRILQILREQAQGDVEKFRNEIETWFNDSMERLSGWYKQRVTGMLTVLAFIIVLASNADTLAITNRLWQNTNLRASVATAGQQFVVQPPFGNTSALEQIAESRAKLESLNLPLGWHGENVTLRNLPMKTIGLLLTTLALSLGAPFWFDLLNKLSNLRLSGKPPEK